MDKKTLESLRKVIAYLFDDEIRDYYERLNNDEDVENHIFNDLMTVGDYASERSAELAKEGELSHSLFAKEQD